MIWKTLFKSEFNKNIIKLFVGTTIAQAIPIALAPILTRLYTPEEFGVFALFFTISNLLGTIACGRYELSIVLPTDEEDAFNLEMLCYIIAVSFGVVLLIFISLFYHNILTWLGSHEIGYWLFLIPVSVTLTGVIQTKTYQLNRRKSFSKISYLKMIQTSSTGFTNILFGITHWLKNALIIGHLVGQALAIGFFQVKNNNYRPDWKRIKTLAKKYKSFIYNTPSSLLNTTASSLPILHITKVMGNKEVGFYGLVERSVNAPLSLISYSISQVLLEEIAFRHKSNLPIRPQIVRLAKNLLLIGIIPFSLLFFFSEDIFAIVFGEEWRKAGEYASVLSIGFLFKFVVSPLSVILISTNNMKKLVSWQTLYFLTTLSIIAINGYDPQIRLFLILLTTNDVIMYSFYLYIILQSTKSDFNNV